MRKRLSRKLKGIDWKIHFSIAAFSVIALLFMSVIDRGTYATSRTQATVQTPQVSIALQHTGLLNLSLLIVRKGQAGYISVQNESDSPIKISLPALWQRTEVNNATLREVQKEQPSLGYVRWSLPAKVGMKLATDSVPGALEFINASGPTASVRLKTFDLITAKTTSDVVLVQKQTSVQLWTH